MSLKKCECIITRGDKFSETKKVITFFSLEYGKKKGVASGLGKMISRFGSSLEVITHSSLVFYESSRTDLHRIDQCEIIDPFINIKSNLDKLQVATYLTELVRETIPEDEVHADIYKLFLLFLGTINTDPTPPQETMIRFFEIKLLKMLGILPPVDRCCICGSVPEPSGNAFDPACSGIVCKKCSPRTGLPRICRGGLFFIKTVGSIPINKFKNMKIQNKHQEREIREVLHAMVTAFINKELHTYRFLYGTKPKINPHN